MEETSATSDAVHCGSCGGDPEGAILMTCLHVLCRNCAPIATSGSSRRGSEPATLCPVCNPATSHGSKHASQNGMSSLGVSTIAAKPCVSIVELRQRGRGASESNGAPVDDNGDEDGEENGREREETGEGGRETFTTPLTFPCPAHSHRDAEQFCLSCHQLACSKCVTSSHRKCADHLVTCAEAVISQSPLLNSLHSKLAQKVITSQDSLRHEESKVKSIENQRATLVGQITAQREALVRALLEKEAKLVGEVNATLDRMKEGVEERAERDRLSARAAEGQLSVLEAVMSVKGEPEILALLPSLHTRLDAELSNCACAKSDTTSFNLVFNVNKKLEGEIKTSELGQITHADETFKGDNGRKKDESDLRLTLMMSFHARTREDTCDPLLTDLVLLPGGDVILTDRDNKCVKKFNSTGHLLTRVPIPEVPSRIALVSHGKAAISVMNKKVLLFLSLLGTVRILSSVKVKKPYCFLASAGQGLGQGEGQEQGQGQGECQLLAATSLCDVIDLISESGVLLRRLFTQKGDKVNISRPLYLHAPQSRDPQVAALVVDSGRRVLFALTPDGQTTFTFKPKDHNSLECPLGVGTVPGSGLILLADRDKHRVVLLGRRGTFLRQVLGEKEGLHKPCALYAAVSSRLALTQVDGWVKIYKTE